MIGRNPAAFALALGMGCLIWGCSESQSVCSSDQDCPAGRYCRSGDCVFDCTFDQNCPAGFRCNDRGRCERGCAETNDGIEACDGVDNDCDDLTDEDFPDLGQACSNQTCAPGVWDCGPDGTVLCNGPTPSPNDPTCDGLDDDCDGSTDEDAEALACPLEQGVCAGASSACLPGGLREDCDYGPEYTPDRDDTCDHLDNDCDGSTDEDGVLVLQAEVGTQSADGIDNNCNGLTDEPGGLMIRVPVAMMSVWIDAYEVTVFENSDCTGPAYGQLAYDYPAAWPPTGGATIDLYACALPGLIPSGNLSWYQAERACQAQGKRLCTGAEYGAACNNGSSEFYPYGQNFLPGACNDGIDGAGQAVETATYPGCTSGNGTFDMCGNLAEWVDETYPGAPGTAFVAGYGFECVVCQAGLGCEACWPGDPSIAQRVEYLSDCHIQDEAKDAFPMGENLPFIGVRCCLDGP